MGLESVEAALARMYTDDTARERFFADPFRAGASMSLDEEEIASILAMDRTRIELFAGQLRLKRFNEIVRLLPRLHDALGEARLREMFLGFARTFVPEGHHKHQADAMAFAAFAARELTGDGRDAALFDRAATGLFFTPRGAGAIARSGPAVARVHRQGRRFLLWRWRDSSRFRAFRFV